MNMPKKFRLRICIMSVVLLFRSCMSSGIMDDPNAEVSESKSLAIAAAFPLVFN